MNIVKLINQNIYLVTLKRFILFTALLHLTIVLIYSIINVNFSKFNYFDIIDIDLFYPKVAEGITSHIISTITILVVISTTYFISKKRKNR